MTGASNGGLATLLSVIDCIVAAATRDAGTALLDKSTWRARATAALAGQGSRGRASGLLLIDVDEFKQINDRVGHPGADEVLAAVVEAIRSEVRQVDLVGRFGGDEFAVLVCSDRDACAIAEVGERIRARIADLHLDAGSTAGAVPVGPVTVSIGAAQVDPCPNSEPGESGETVLASALWAADRALYRAKDAGRDTVCLAPSPEPASAPSSSGGGGERS